MSREKFLILKNRILCFILPLLGYPVIRGVKFKDGIHISGETKNLVVKNCIFEE